MKCIIYTVFTLFHFHFGCATNFDYCHTAG